MFPPGCSVSSRCSPVRYPHASTKSTHLFLGDHVLCRHLDHWWILSLLVFPTPFLQHSLPNEGVWPWSSEPHLTLLFMVYTIHEIVRSLASSVQLMMFLDTISSSTAASHRSHGLPCFLLPSTFQNTIFFGASSCIRCTCPSHRSCCPRLSFICQHW